MGGRVAVHVSGHVAGDSLGFTLSFGPDKLPITSSILVDLRRLFVSVSPLSLSLTLSRSLALSLCLTGDRAREMKRFHQIHPRISGFILLIRYRAIVWALGRL